MPSSYSYSKSNSRVRDPSFTPSDGISLFKHHACVGWPQCRNAIIVIAFLLSLIDLWSRERAIHESIKEASEVAMNVRGDGRILVVLDTPVEDKNSIKATQHADEGSNNWQQSSSTSLFKRYEWLRIESMLKEDETTRVESKSAQDNANQQQQHKVLPSIAASVYRQQLEALGRTQETGPKDIQPKPKLMRQETSLMETRTKIGSTAAGIHGSIDGIKSTRTSALSTSENEYNATTLRGKKFPFPVKANETSVTEKSSAGAQHQPKKQNSLPVTVATNNNKVTMQQKGNDPDNSKSAMFLRNNQDRPTRISEQTKHVKKSLTKRQQPKRTTNPLFWLQSKTFKIVHRRLISTSKFSKYTTKSTRMMVDNNNKKHNFHPVTKRPSAFFWDIPQSGGTVLNEFCNCLNLTIASNGAPFGQRHGSTTNQDYSKKNYLNLDIVSKQGVERAKTMRLFEQDDLADIYMTPHFASAVQAIYSPDQKQGMAFTIMRHPIDRALSIFYSHSKNEHRFSGDTASWKKNWTIEDYIKNNIVDSNWMIRSLLDPQLQEDGDATTKVLTREDLDVAKSILSEKIWVGFTDKLTETLLRLGKIFDWTQKLQFQPCLRRLIVHPPRRALSTDSWEWQELAKIHSLDVELYEYALDLWETQGKMLESLPLFGGTGANVQ